jgi:biopolymer transport protein ExbB
MIGLFGTVYGMIVAFGSIVASGGNADPVALAGGIGTALVTTFWGLLVAIPALAGYATIRNRIDALNGEAEGQVLEMLQRFKPKNEESMSKPESKTAT